MSSVTQGAHAPSIPSDMQICTSLIPRDYQSQAVDKARELIAKRVRRIIINAPTGAGKTAVAVFIMLLAIAKGKRILFVAHRRELIDQAIAKLIDAGIHDYGVIMAGDKRTNTTAPVQVASIQTLIRRELPPADLLIIDEAHRAISRGYMTLAQNYPRAVIIGLTATPERLDGKGLDHLFDDMVAVETVPGLIERGYLVKPRCYIGPAADTSAVITKRGDYDEAQLAAASDTPKLVGDIVANWKRLANGRKTAVFAVNVEHAHHIAKEFWAAGVPAATLVGTTPKAERAAILADWRGGAITVVTSVMILVEGFDFPELECLILARKTQSVSLYLQAAGRVLRPAPGKTDALILDHADCVRMHGPPHIHREWSLEGAKGKSREVGELFDCPQCHLAFDPDAKVWLAEDQTTLKAGHAEYARKVLKTSKGARALSACPGCGTATCRVCQSPFKLRAERVDIDGIGWTQVALCPHCGAQYSDEAAHLVADEEAGSRELPETTDDLLVEMTEDAVPTQVVVLNDYRRLLRMAKERGAKRGWVFHRLREQYDEETLRECLPRHTGEWWRAQA